jgi:hypothetical protein
VLPQQSEVPKSKAANFLGFAASSKYVRKHGIDPLAVARTMSTIPAISIHGDSNYVRTRAATPDISVDLTNEF